MDQAVEECRLCGNRALPVILDLGVQCLTGVFPPADAPSPAGGPLELVKCHGGENACGLVQLRHSFDASQMYGANYGYRSSLNRSMVNHLERIVENLMSRVKLQDSDVVLDIGSNDGTLLSFYPDELLRIGMDPTSARFREYYKPGIRVVADFFSSALFFSETEGRRAKLITSIAMMYDLPRPLDFVREVAEILDREGLWLFEQSYLPAMIEANAYDTVCHEHLEYYTLTVIEWMLRRSGLKIVDVTLNDVNGGSFVVIAAHRESAHEEASAKVRGLLEKERSLGLDDLAIYEDFRARVESHRSGLRGVLRGLKTEGKRVFGYGASTKGNVLLQFCGIGPEDIISIAEVNEDKFGCVTPGSRIPIASEKEVRSRKPDVFVVFPWHFRDFIIEKEQEFLAGGGTLLFPLPVIELVSR